jgi:hypothetical protein
MLPARVTDGALGLLRNRVGRLVRLLNIFAEKKSPPPLNVLAMECQMIGDVAWLLAPESVADALATKHSLDARRATRRADRVPCSKAVGQQDPLITRAPVGCEAVRARDLLYLSGPECTVLLGSRADHTPCQGSARCSVPRTWRDVSGVKSDFVVPDVLDRFS